MINEVEKYSGWENLQINKWYSSSEREIYFRFNEKMRGTHAILRGRPQNLVDLFLQIEREYFGKVGFVTGHIYNEFEKISKEGGQESNSRIYFKDDRVIGMRRLDHPTYDDLDCPPLFGSSEHIEVIMREQYGGNWPPRSWPKDIDSFPDSRITFMCKILNAIEGAQNESRL